MVKINVDVESQEPIGNSVFHEIKLSLSNGSQISYGHMYFVANVDKVICQYPEWLPKDQQVLTALRKKGFKFNGE